MKKLLTILLISMTIKGHSQYATKKYVDSLYYTIDSTIILPTVITTTNQTVTIDTLTIGSNSTKTFHLFIETDDDMAEKKVKIKNITGIYSIVKDKDQLLLATNNFMSTVPRWNIKLVNNKVVVQITGTNTKRIAWTLSKSIL